VSIYFFIKTKLLITHIRIIIESLTDYEDPNKPLQKQHLESWFDINVWSLVVDHGLRNVIGMETVRYVHASYYLF
jgi:hypothetical protein